MHIIIDGYNLIRQSARLRPLEKKGLEDGREALIRQLILYRRIRRHKISVIFDGQEGIAHPTSPLTREGVRIIFSATPEKADDVIKKMTARGDEEFLVVTSDRDIINYVSRRGGGTISSVAFEEQIVRLIAAPDEPPEDSRDDDEGKRCPGTRKKGPARRPSRQEKINLSRTVKL